MVDSRDYEGMGITKEEFQEHIRTCVRFSQETLKVSPNAASNVLFEAALVIIAGHIPDEVGLEAIIKDIHDNFPRILRDYHWNFKSSKTQH